MAISRWEIIPSVTMTFISKIGVESSPLLGGREIHTCGAIFNSGIINEHDAGIFAHGY